MGLLSFASSAGGGSILGGIGGALLGGAFGQRQASKQMDFQAQQSATAHQREVKDLRAAGLNPILSASKGGAGASTPTGAMSNVDVASSAKQGMLLAQEIRKLTAEADVVENAVPETEFKSNLYNNLNDLMFENGQATNSAKAVAAAAGAYGAQKMFKKGGKKLKPQSKTNTKPKKYKSKSRGGGGMNMPFKNPRANIFKKF
jgi:hypothetical protein